MNNSCGESTAHDADAVNATLARLELGYDRQSVTT